MSPHEKPLRWLHGMVRTPPLSSEARIEAGYLLRRLQRGESLGPPPSRPLPVIGPRCHELRIVDRDNTWRILYRIDTDAVVILEAFPKRTRALPDSIREACRQKTEGLWTMTSARNAKLKAKGWRSGSAADFLGLSPEENYFVELKLKLADDLRKRRTHRRISQQELARLIGSSQSRVAKMESGDASVSIDLLFKCLLAIGAKPRDLGRSIAA